MEVEREQGCALGPSALRIGAGQGPYLTPVPSRDRIGVPVGRAPPAHPAAAARAAAALATGMRPWLMAWWRLERRKE